MFWFIHNIIYSKWQQLILISSPQNRNYKSWIHIMYFCNTMVMVIVRAMTVLKYAAGIASVAKRPLKVIRQIPTEFWNDELQRLFHMMSHDVVALSGCGFFYLTKSLFLVVSIGNPPPPGWVNAASPVANNLSPLLFHATTTTTHMDVSECSWWEPWPHMNW